MFAAYKFVAITVLLAEANFNAYRLRLPIQQPITENELTFKLIAPPNILPYGGFMGSIRTEQYAFSEGGDRGYRYVIKIDPFGNQSTAEQNEMLSREKALIDAKQAYRLATNWLASIDVDVQRLEKSFRPEVRQRSYYGEGNANPEIRLPIFYVKWGPWDEPKVEVTVDGRSKQFLEIRQEDSTFSRRPRALIRDVDKLLAISDEEFSKYSPLDRSSLIARFAVNVPLTNAPPNTAKGSPLKP